VNRSSEEVNKGREQGSGIRKANCAGAVGIGCSFLPETLAFPRNAGSKAKRPLVGGRILFCCYFKYGRFDELISNFWKFIFAIKSMT